MLRTMTGRPSVGLGRFHHVHSTTRSNFSNIAKRSYTTTPSKSNVLPIPPTSTTTGTSPQPIFIKPRKSLTRRILTPIALLTLTFYGVSIPLGYSSLRYRDFLVESVYGGQYIGDALDKYDLDRNSSISHKALSTEEKVENALAKANSTIPNHVAGGGARKETELTRYAESKAKAEGWQLKKGDKADPIRAREELKAKATEATERISTKAQQAKDAAMDKAKMARDEAGQVGQQVKDKVEHVKERLGQVAQKVEDKVEQVKDTVVASAPHVEEPKSTLPIFAQRPRELDATPLPAKKAPSGTPYQGPPLPIGFEPAPGFEAPRAPPTPKGQIKPVPPPPQPLPLIAPAISSDEKAASEPMLGRLASTIDSLAQFVENSDEGKASAATTVLKGAQSDLQHLASKLESIKKSEEAKLSNSLNQQASEYSALLHKAEKDLIERLDTQEEDWKKAFDDERKKLVEAYKNKLNTELETQKELIDERLKKEVVAQGIELQRRWVQEIKTKVEQERGGRLAKLEELEGGIRTLEKVAKDNVESLSEAQRARKVFTAVKAVEHAIESGRPFTTELNALRALAKEEQEAATTSTKGEKSSSSSEPAVLATALSTIPNDVASTGVASFVSLSTRFTNSVAPQLRKVALLPEHAGFWDYLRFSTLSRLLFEREGWAEGDDVVSTIARAKWHLAQKDLDLATREINQLQGWPKALAKDWLKAARNHLEVQQALDIAEAESTVQGLKSL